MIKQPLMRYGPIPVRLSLQSRDRETLGKKSGARERQREASTEKERKRASDNSSVLVCVGVFKTETQGYLAHNKLPPPSTTIGPWA